MNATPEMLIKVFEASGNMFYPSLPAETAMRIILGMRMHRFEIMLNEQMAQLKKKYSVK